MDMDSKWLQLGASPHALSSFEKEREII